VTATLEVAIVGAGLMGGWHARYAHAAGAQVVGIVDPRTERARELAGRYGARAFDGLHTCLREAKPRIVHVCTEASRRELAQEALEAGVHVLVEKPVAISTAEASLLLRSAEGRELRVCPVHQFGLQRGFRRLLREKASLGNLVSVQGRVASAGGEGRSAAERRAILLGMVPHFLSLFRALAGPLPAEGWHRLLATDDDLEVTGGVNDVPVSLSLSLRARPRANELRVFGTQGSARVDLYHGFVVFERGPVSRAGKLRAPFRDAALLATAASVNLAARFVRGEPAFPGLRNLIEAFYLSVSDGSPSPLAAEEILETAAVVERLMCA